jgi:predicted nucleic acid-binding protein
VKICVIDCSFFISALLPDEKNHNFDFAAFSVHVPAIFFPECLNVLATALKKQRITKNQYEECIIAFKDLPFSVDHLSSIQDSLYSIADLSERNNLTSYDASYLELALRLKAPLGTFDKKIIEACKKEKVINL